MKTILLIAFFIVSNSLQAQWVSTSGPGTGASVRCLFADGTNLFAGSWGGPNGYPGGAYLTTNNGLNWLARNNGLTDTAVFGYAVIGTNLFAGTYLGGVCRSSNNGTNWVPVNSGLTNINIYSIIAAGTNLYAGTGNGVFLSTNNGAAWIYKGLTGNLIFALGAIGSDIFAGTSGDGVYRSSNSGTNWIQTNTGLTNTAIQSLAASGADLYAGTFNGVFRTTNNGANWINTGGLAGLIINTVTASGGNIFAGSSGGGIFLTTNSGANWTSVGVGMPNTTINTLIVSGSYIFAGALSGMVYRRTLSEMITSVNMVSSEIPVDFSMSQNYPNPFNPTTNVKIQMPKGGFVKLTVFDISGKEVKILVNEYLGAGTYKIDFDASQYSSGIYFYTMTTAGYSQTRKMVLIK
jgi:Secretion system C-terminal sorting domain